MKRAHAPLAKTLFAAAPSPVTPRVASSCVALNALLLFCLFCSKPAPPSAGHTHAPPVATRTAEAPPAPISEKDALQVELELPPPPRLEQAAEALEVAPVLAVEGRLFALDPEPAPASREARRRAQDASTLALPGGAALTVAPHPHRDGELADSTWTVVSDEGTCFARASRRVDLILEAAEPGAHGERLTGTELLGCTTPLGTTDRALAVHGDHPEARFESYEARGSCQDAREFDAEHPTDALRDGFDPEGRVLLPGHELLMLRSAGDDAGLRILERRGAATSLVVDEPFSPLWRATATEDAPLGC